MLLKKPNYFTTKINIPFGNCKCRVIYSKIKYPKKGIIIYIQKLLVLQPYFDPC